MSIYESRVTRVDMAPTVKDLRPAMPSPPYFGEWAEYVTGGWQKNLVPPTRESVLANSAVYSAISLIAGDIAKLRIKLTRRQSDGTWREIEGGVADDNSPFLKVLRKPNGYETRNQFIRAWVTQKLCHGNAYIGKERDERRVVRELHVLDSVTTTPLVAESGDVFYRLGKDRLAKVRKADTIVPASEVMHDRSVCFWHPLIGVSPIFAAASSAAHGNAIQANGQKFFENQSRPSGLLIYPQPIKTPQAQDIKEKFEAGFSGANIGRFAVLGGDAKYTALTIPAQDSQLIEQLGWTVGDVARAFHIPGYKLGLQTNMTFSNAGQQNQDYYSQCLQELLEDLEALLDDGLSLPADIGVEFDLDGLMRMDPTAQADIDQKEVGAGILAPNEARRKRNLTPKTGGESPMMQQQNYSLEALAKRDAAEDPFKKPEATPPPSPEPETDETDAAKEMQALIGRFNRSAFNV
jgi:HK97 family phage portal protein